MLAFGKQALEIACGARIRVIGNDQALDRRIVGDLQRAVDPCSRQQQKSCRNPAAQTENANEDLDEPGCGRHMHAEIQGLIERAGTARPGMIA